MNLNSIVSSALRAVPTGIRGLITINDKIGPSRDAISGAATDAPATRAPFTVACVVVPPKTIRVDGVARAPLYDREVTLAAAECTFAPEVGMTGTLGTTVYRILKVTPLDPTGIAPALYTLGMSK
jgi:hypothetical protein